MSKKDKIVDYILDKTGARERKDDKAIAAKLVHLGLAEVGTCIILNLSPNMKVETNMIVVIFPELLSAFQKQKLNELANDSTLSDVIIFDMGLFNREVHNLDNVMSEDAFLQPNIYLIAEYLKARGGISKI